MAAKRSTATAFAEAVCRVGWGLQGAATGPLAASSILVMGDSRPTCCRAALWGLSSSITGIDRGSGTPAAGDDHVSLVFTVAQALWAAQRDDGVAAEMPAAFDWLGPLTR
jgi:hypothetical protein